MAVFVSYAQNFEDVILWRALQDVSNGFYIDLGAADPLADSVTYAFYERGWRGINVEPNPASFARLMVARTRDINVNVSVGAAEGEETLFVVDDDDRLSTANADLVRDYEDAGRSVHAVRSGVTSLAALCEAHVTGNIHFLKVDVEGAEQAAFQGADFARWRPWIVLVESLHPITLDSTHMDWEGILHEASYHFVYFDGLNRFYVADEHRRLDAAFAAPPNIRDFFVRSAEALQLRLKDLEAGFSRQALAWQWDVLRLTAERDACIADRQKLAEELRAEIQRLVTEREGGVRECERLSNELAACVLGRDTLAKELRAEVARLATAYDARIEDRQKEP